MAKKENKLSFGQLPTPKGVSSYMTTKLNWIGLNKRDNLNTGELSFEKNISTQEYPYLTPAKKIEKDGKSVTLNDGGAFGVYSADGIFVVIYGTVSDKYQIIADAHLGKTSVYSIYEADVGNNLNASVYEFDGSDYFVTNDGTAQDGKTYYKRTKKEITLSLVVESFDTKSEYDNFFDNTLCISMFNQYTSGVTALDGTYSKKLVILPLKKTMPLKFISCPTVGNGENMDKTATDTSKIYFYVTGDNSVLAYSWNGEKYVCISPGSNSNSGGKDYCLPSLSVNVKNYYNDGYKLTSDTYINTKTYYTKAEADDGAISYNKIANPDASELGTYYEYANGRYFLTDDKELPATKTYYTMTEDGGARTYNPVTSPNASDLYKYYEKCWEYTKTSDTEVIEGKAYYELSDDKTSYIYVSEPKEEDVENYYEITGTNYQPPSYADTSAYYFNTYNNTVYAYVTDEQADLVEDENYTSGWKETSIPSFPDLKYATVHQSRLFGVSDDMIYASGFNDYSNWNYDTILDENANNAWYSTVQSNVKATGEFTGITTYGNHVIAFKRDFMHEIYNSKNPFRIVDIGAYGTIDNRSICEVGGKLIFVSESNVCVYTGATPRNIGDNLNIDRFTYAVACSYKDRFYYLFCRDGENTDYLFVYDTKIGAWSELYMESDSSCDIVNFAVADDELYALRSDGALLNLTGDDYSDNWEFETDIVTGTSSSSTYENVNIKHIRKIQFLVTAGVGSKFEIYGMYDHDSNVKNENLLYKYDGADKGDKTFVVRIKPRKTAGYGFKLHFEGSGYVKFGEIEVYMTKGGELFE